MARNRAELGPATIPLRHELAEFSTENDSHNDSFDFADSSSMTRIRARKTRGY